MLARCVDWFCRDRRTGRIVIGQWPNVPLWIFLASTAVEHSASGRVRDAASWTALISLIVWASDEVLRGVNPWRRSLGAGVLAWIAISGAV